MQLSIFISKLENKVRTTWKRMLTNVCEVYSFTKNAEKGRMAERVFKAVAITDLEKQTLDLEQDTRKMYEERFQDGCTLYYILEENRMIAYGWKQSTSNFYVWEIARNINFDEKVEMLFDFAVAEEQRGKGIYTYLLKQIILDAENDRKLVIFALKDNIPSLKGIRRAGFSFWKSISHFK